MAEYNGVTLEPLMDGSQDRDYQVEQFIFWGGRACGSIGFISKIQ
nr:hypothetical protein [Veillonella denticariosi]